MLPKDIFQKHEHIGLDFDDTLLETTLEGLEALHKKGKMLHMKTIEDIKEFDWLKIPGCDLSYEELMLFWQTHEFLSIPPIPHAKLGLDRFIQKKKKVSIVTARNEKEFKDMVCEWFRLHFPIFSTENVHFVNRVPTDFIPKSALCKDLGITLFIDDAMHNAQDFVENGISCILVDKPWNRDIVYSHPELYRAQSWEEIIDVL